MRKMAGMQKWKMMSVVALAVVAIVVAVLYVSSLP
jgi:hypothetical protein